MWGRWEPASWFTPSGLCHVGSHPRNMERFDACALGQHLVPALAACTVHVPYAIAVARKPRPNAWEDEYIRNQLRGTVLRGVKLRVKLRTDNLSVISRVSVNLVPLLLTGVLLHPSGRTDKNLCRCFGAPARRVSLIT